MRKSMKLLAQATFAALTISQAGVFASPASEGSALPVDEQEVTEAPRVRELTAPLGGSIMFPSQRVISMHFDNGWAVEEAKNVTYQALAPTSVRMDLKSVSSDFDIDRITYTVIPGARLVQHLSEPVVIIEGMQRYTTAGNPLLDFPAGSHGLQTKAASSACGKTYGVGGWNSMSTSGGCWGQSGISGGCITKSCNLQNTCAGTVNTDAGNDAIEGVCGQTVTNTCSGVLSVDC